jgi:hypothetical protein
VEHSPEISSKNSIQAGSKQEGRGVRVGLAHETSLVSLLRERESNGWWRRGRWDQAEGSAASL